MLSDDTVVQNYAGKLGAYISGSLSDLFGIAAYVWPLVFGAVGIACIVPAYELVWWRWLGYFLLTICLLFIGAAFDIQIGEIYSGGMVGATLYEHASAMLSHWGSVILWFFLFTMATQLTFGISWLNVCRKIKLLCQTRISAVHMPALPEFKMPALPSPKSLMEKISSKPAHAPMPDVYDIEGHDVDDPNIRVVPKKKPRKAQPSNATAADATHKASHTQEPKHAHDEYEDYDEYDEDMTEESVQDHKQNAAAYDHQQKHTAHDDHDDQRYDEQHYDAQTYDEQKDDTSYQDAHEYMDDIHEEAPQAAPQAEKKSRGLFSFGKKDHEAPKASSQPSSQPLAPSPMARPGVKTKYEFPSLELLQNATPSSPTARGEMEQKGQALVSCLSDFGIQGELVRITPGPVVTMYEFRPAAGIRVNRIANLTDDIALALKAIAIRIQAPIPGSDTVGIEIPNIQRDIVNFREILESKAFTDAGGPLNMVLGKNIAGKPFVAELSKMPHLLVAGATGAGKSVGLNAILMSLLYTTQPDDMQLLLIDPKRIEMAVYADLPHLVHPVVTEMQFAKTALEWAVAEMDKRYEAMARLGVRNITGYNQKLKELGDNRPPELAELEPLPYLVIIIDELADLMLTAAREVETSIVRLAQLARAAGIHMILATQRPSVDVVTGIIKANFPCRISFQVTSKHDSRTILDMVGAEHLLGKGDMLYKPSGGRLMRLHGPFVPDEEVQAVVSHWKRQSPPKYKVDFAAWGTEQNEVSSPGLGDASEDSLYPQVRAFVEEQGKASISLVQRRFRIGFNRAAVLMEQLERDGIIGPADGSKPRSVIR